jgi:hypothetical protein
MRSMPPAVRRKPLPVRFATLVSLVGLLAALVLSGMLTPGGLRRSAAPQADPEPVIRLNDPSICVVCGVVEAVRPHETRVPRDAANSGASAARTAWRVTVRMEDGSYRTLSQADPPAFRPGDRVRITDGAIAAR